MHIQDSIPKNKNLQCDFYMQQKKFPRVLICNFVGVTGSKRRCACRGSFPKTFRFRCKTSRFFSTFLPSTAKLRIWTLRIWGFRGPGFRSARQVLCGDASRLFLGHLSKHLRSVSGRTEVCHEVRNPGPQKPQIIRNENHHLALFDFNLLHYSSLIFSRILLFQCTTSSRFNSFKNFCTTVPEVHWNSPTFPRFCPFCVRFLLFQCRIPCFCISFLSFCTNVCGFSMQSSTADPRWLWADQFREASTQAHAHTTCTHTMVPAESVKICKNSDPKQ